MSGSPAEGRKRNVSPDNNMSPDKLAPAVVKTIATDLLDLKPKQGILMTEGQQEPSMAWELWESKGGNWLTDGWSLDIITTDKRGGVGIAKDVYESDSLSVDLGAYVTQEYEGLFNGNIDPKVGMGMSVSF